MATLLPFKALRPVPENAARVASVPYDVVNTDEARSIASGNPLSFLRVTRAEIDLPPDTNPYDARVYAQAVRNFEELKRGAPMVLDDEPSLYFYRLRMDGHEQVGVAGCFSLEEYDRGLIKKHEKTRKDKEDDRTRHMVELRAQTGVVFLTYRASDALNAIAERTTRSRPLYDFVADDSIAHSMWRVTGSDAAAIVDAFGDLPAVYIADGHHRVASAARARDTLGATGARANTPSSFIAVAFPDTEVKILSYNRVVRDLQGQTPGAFLDAACKRTSVSDGNPSSTRRREAGMYLEGRWHAVALPEPSGAATPAERLDVEILQREILGPLLGVGDPRTDKRIDFVGGIRGTPELQRLVDTGKAAVAFALHPVGIDDLMAIADAGEIMPPKSTWFEPKLRDGLLVHLI